MAAGRHKGVSDVKKKIAVLKQVSLFAGLAAVLLGVMLSVAPT